MWIVLSTCLLAFTRLVLSLPTCGENDFHYEFTECDSHNGRWRVSVPQNPDTCEKGTPKLPRRENNCENSCPPGQYLDVNSEEMKCQKCPAGTYSLGGGVRYTNWQTLPQGFDSSGSPTEIYYNSYDQSYYRQDNTDDTNSTCKMNGGWFPKGDHTSSSTSKCTSTLTYAVTLVKKGFVKFKYQFTDMYTVFRFFVRNSQCVKAIQTKDEFPDETDLTSDEWKEYKVELQAGRNLITWVASIIEWEDTEEDKIYTPIRIKEIIFEGVGFTSECSDCDAGTYSDEGAPFCKMCPANHFSAIKAATCLQCNTQTQYSLEGSPNCTERAACSVNDFYETRSPCDENGKTKVMYKWIEPKICREDISGARQLPASGSEEECKHCNPGMFLNTTTKSCQFCPEKTISNGSACEPCLVGTSPQYEYNIKWWNDFLPNMKASCFSHFDRGCATRHGWQLQNTFLTSGTSHSDDAMLWLKLSIDNGFLGSESVVNGKPGEVGELSFQFETVCSADCVLRLKEYAQGSITLLSDWKGAQPRTNYNYIVTSTKPTSFMWYFTKSTKSRRDDETAAYKYINDKITIYFIKLTNVAKGGASVCRKCPLGSTDDKCSKCPEGHYLDTKQEKCFKCPKNTFLNVSNPYEKKSCIPCGAGLHSPAGSTECFSDCRYVNELRSYDFTTLSGFHHVNGDDSFTSRGSRYYHSFNISLCGHNVDATCRSNISVGSNQRQEEDVSGSICRLTMIPTQDGQLLAGQPMVLSHQLMSVSQDLPNGLSINDLFQVQSDNNNASDFVFNYQSALKTVACANGFSSHIVLRCDITAPGRGILTLPPKCQAGTCDGCRFMFLLRSKYACPLCQQTDYSSVTTACVHGQKSDHFMWNEPKFCRDGILLPEIQNKTCSIFEQTVGSAVLDFKIVLGVAALLAVLLVFAVIGLWYRNRKLTYKYTRLVNASGKPGELPQAERCALDEDEEDNDEEVHFKKSRGKDIMNKLRHMAGNKRDDKSRRNFLGDSEDEEYESHELHPHSSDDRV